MKADFESRKFDVLIAWDADRISRSSWERDRFLTEVHHRGQRVLTISDELDSDSKSSLSREEQEKLTRRAATHRGLKNTWEHGLAAGGRCYGYSSVRVQPGHPHYDCNRPQRAIRVINESEAVWERKMFEWRGNEGMSCDLIANWVTEAKVPPAGAAWNREHRLCKQWYDSAVRVILRNPIYKGIYRGTLLTATETPSTTRRRGESATGMPSRFTRRGCLN